MAELRLTVRIDDEALRRTAAHIRADVIADGYAAQPVDVIAAELLEGWANELETNPLPLVDGCTFTGQVIQGIGA